VAVKLEFGTYGGVTSCILGGETGVVSTTGSLVVVGEIDRGNVVDTCTGAGREVETANLGSGGGDGTLGTCNVINEVGVAEGTGRPTRFDVGSKSGKRVKETIGVDRGEGVVVEVISVVVPLVDVGGCARITLADPDKFLNGVVEVKFNLNVLGSDGFVAGEL